MKMLCFIYTVSRREGWYAIIKLRTPDLLEFRMGTCAQWFTEEIPTIKEHVFLKKKKSCS